MRTPPAVLISRLIVAGSVLTMGLPRVIDDSSESDSNSCFRRVARSASPAPVFAPAVMVASAPSVSAISVQVTFLINNNS